MWINKDPPQSIFWIVRKFLLEQIIWLSVFPSTESTVTSFILKQVSTCLQHCLWFGTNILLNNSLLANYKSRIWILINTAHSVLWLAAQYHVISNLRSDWLLGQSLEKDNCRLENTVRQRRAWVEIELDWKGEYNPA